MIVIPLLLTLVFVMLMGIVSVRTTFVAVATLVLEGQRAVPRKLEELGFTFRFSDIEEALVALEGSM